MNRRRKKRFKLVILSIFVVALLIADFGVLYGFSITTEESISTEKADALYGGEADAYAYPYAGYLVDYSSFFTSQVCGVTFLSSQIGISAAHCFEPDGLYFAGVGELKTPPEQNYPIKKYMFGEKWIPETLDGDVAVLSLEDPVPISDLSQYAKIATPQEGCNYEILAYGSTDQRTLSTRDLRRKADVCIENVTPERFYFTSKSGGICFGDSGSPIFVKGTSKVVGIVSAITADNAEYNEDNCFVNNRAVATRLDSSLSFIASKEAPLKESAYCPEGSSVRCDIGETCRSNACRGFDDYVYSSSLDYRSVDFILSEYSMTGFAVMFFGGTLLFLGLLYRSFRKAY